MKRNESGETIENHPKPNIRPDDGVVMTRKSLSLCSVARGRKYVILDTPKGWGRTHLIRLGIMTGEVITCVERLPGGTVVVEKNRQEIAIGSALAKSILVNCTVND